MKTKFVIKGHINDKVLYYNKTTKAKLWQTDWDLPNFVESIDNATLFDSSEVAEDICSTIEFSDFKIYPVCPICGEAYDGHPAISREDNKTAICSYCGIGEAFMDFITYVKKKNIESIKN